MDTSCTCPPEAGATTCEHRIGQSPEHCPTNGQRGRAVDSVTLKALLARPLTEVHDTDYRFCPDPTCPTVYYGTDGQCFREEDLRERVYQKHPDDDTVFVCYCFRHRVGDVRRDGAAPENARIAAITAGIVAGKCACDLRNPQGSCCLGNARALL